IDINGVIYTAASSGVNVSGNAGQYTFQIFPAANYPAGQAAYVHVTARDLDGNLSTRNVIFNQPATVVVEPVDPDPENPDPEEPGPIDPDPGDPVVIPPEVCDCPTGTPIEIIRELIREQQALPLPPRTIIETVFRDVSVPSATAVVSGALIL